MNPPSSSPAPTMPPQSLLTGLSARDLMAQMMEPTQPGDTVAAAPPPTMKELAPHFPKLEILECLGRGGMGVVYKARQKSLNRLVALKLLAPERADDPAFAARFEREAHALAALNHPHIVGVHDSGQAGGFYYLLMEFVDGVNLRQLMLTKRLAPKEALSIVPPICEALQCAHDHGIVHCDIKPENLLIDKAGVVKIADFGIAKMVGHSSGVASVSPEGTISESRTTCLPGTPDYAAPEQAGGQADHRADIYSLGVVLYEMLTGERPKDKLEAPSKRVPLDLRIDEVVLRALERQPELRFATAADLRQSIEALVASSGSSAVATVSASPRPSLGRRGIFALVTAVPLLLAAGVGLFLRYGMHRPKVGIPGAEWVDFNMGRLSDVFSQNTLFGRGHYGLTPLGLADTHGIVTAENMTSEGTLVYRKKSYDMSRLASLELSCCFRRSEIGAESHALTLGLTGNLDGHLSGVPGAAFMALRLKVDGDTLRLQFVNKEASTGAPRSWQSTNNFTTHAGQWYRLRVEFARVDEQTVLVSGDVCELDRHGNDGLKIGFFVPRHFAEPIFPVKQILDDHDVWVALRAHGPGGAALIDDLQILARPLQTSLVRAEGNNP